MKENIKLENTATKTTRWPENQTSKLGNRKLWDNSNQLIFVIEIPGREQKEWAVCVCGGGETFTEVSFPNLVKTVNPHTQEVQLIQASHTKADLNHNQTD